ncbi:hypothetical protein EC2772a_84c00010 [Escherichia coli]|nr:hypothetical protein EC2772a_84c00010 [Escherichia coli]
MLPVVASFLLTICHPNTALPAQWYKLISAVTVKHGAISPATLSAINLLKMAHVAFLFVKRLLCWILISLAPCNTRRCGGYSIIWGDKAVSFLSLRMRIMPVYQLPTSPTAPVEHNCSANWGEHSVSAITSGTLCRTVLYLWGAQLIHGLPVLPCRIFRNSTHSGKAAETASTSCLWKLCDRA